MTEEAPAPGTGAFETLRRAHADGRLSLFIDAYALNRPGSPVYSPLDVFAPPMVLLASSLTLLFAAGIIAWMIALSLILAYQIVAARRVVEWRLRRRTVSAALASDYNFALLWGMGGLAIALKAWPEKNCVSPKGDWRAFIAENFDAGG